MKSETTEEKLNSLIELVFVMADHVDLLVSESPDYADSRRYLDPFWKAVSKFKSRFDDEE